MKSSLRLSTYFILVLSLDDFYYTFERQNIIFSQQKGNPFLSGRGPPGTHDIPLCLTTFRSIESAKKDKLTEIVLPRYDKSLNEGKGDRVYEKISLDPKKPWLVLFEGWFVGFTAWDSNEQSMMQNIQVDIHLFEMNEMLKEYQLIWNTFHCQIYIDIPDLSWIYDWRWEQELSLIQKYKENNMSKKVLSRDEVNRLVNRCMPIYENFRPSLSLKKTAMLFIELDRNRAIKNIHFIN